MIEEFALWLNCNPMTQDLTACAINTVLILPGLMGILMMFLVYLIAVPILIYKGIAALIRRVFSSHSL